MRGAHRLETLDALRGLAALAVVAYHYFSAYFWFGLMGVELFFVISGFVILMTLERARSVREFAIGRAARLYPVYWLSVAVVGALVLANHEFGLSTTLLNATMLQMFFGQPNISTPYWTLAYELWFYVVMAGIFAMGRLRSIDAIALAWLCLVIVFRSATLVTGRGLGLWHNPAVELLLMPHYGHLFVAGMMLYRIHKGAAGALTYVVLALAVGYSLFGRTDWAAIPAVIYFPVTVLIVLTVWAAAAGRLRMLNAPSLLAVGGCSYALYLLHEPILRVAGLLSGDLGALYLFRALIVLPLSIGASLLVRKYLELPAQALIKRRLSPRPALVAA